MRGNAMRWILGIGLGAVLLALGFAAGTRAQSVSETRTFVSEGGTRLEVLLTERTLGSAEVELGEITFPPNADSGGHVHGATEIFYVLEGTLEHVVNGERHMLEPGMVGFVKPPDEVIHRTGPGGPVRALVIWAPGGEAGRITRTWTPEP